MSKLKIDLKENGLHSLWRGIEAYQEYTQAQDKWLLKEAIMFVHHGIELLMKEILVEHSEYLIFDDIGRDTVKKQKKANLEKTGVFYLQDPPKTVTFLDAIKRVEAFVQSSELDEALATWLYELNQLRNQLEHYAIEADAERVVKLLSNIREPLLELFEAQIGGIKREEPEQISNAWTNVKNIASEALLKEVEVAELIQHFQGQEIPGRIFSLDGSIILPTFKHVQHNFRINKLQHRTIVDVFAESDSESWVIEVKMGRFLSPQALYQVSAVSSALDNAVPWLVFFGKLHNPMREQARDLGILLTGSQEWQELKNIIGKVE
ncbi:MAG: hypothetical protein JXA33_16960 [Anaerolineae bacterium]|nr:hypothetical protein [Anaerolineae bacterium]